MTVERLRPGEQVDPQRFNQLVDALNSKALSSPSIAVQDGAGGTGLVPSRTLQPVWGRLTDEGPEDSPDHYYQWEQVYQDNDGKWRSVREDSDGGYGSQLVPGDAYPYDNLLLNPAVEVNSHSALIDQVVRLTPTRLIVDANGNVHRAWQFTRDVLRPFRLKEGLYPTGPVAGIAEDHGDDPADSHIDANHIHWTQVVPSPVFAPGWRATSIQAEWLDMPDTDVDEREVTLYAEHESGHPAGDQFFSLGLGRGHTDYSRGTKGWAKYVPHGTIVDIDSNGEDVWRGEWQIVKLDAETVILVLNQDSTIQPGEIGPMWTLPLKKTADGPQVSRINGLAIMVFNDLPVPIATGSIHKVHFSKEFYIWFPVTPLASEHGETVYAHASVDALANEVGIPADVGPPAHEGNDNPGDWVTVPFDTAMAIFGNDVKLVGNELQNAGDVPLVGTVSWKVTARRLQAGVAADIDSRLEVALFKKGELVVGTSGEITSSRRIAAGEGKNASNSDANSIIQSLQPGYGLEVKIRVKNSADVPDDAWQTVIDMCTLTFVSKAGVFLREPE